MFLRPAPLLNLPTHSSSSSAAAPSMQSPPHSARCLSPSSSIFSACSALNAMIRSSLPPATKQAAIITPEASQLESPFSFDTARNPIRAVKKSPKQTKLVTRVTKPASTNSSIPRSAYRKRRRTSEDDTQDRRTSTSATSTALPSTPKRICRYPPSLPLGLERSDFDSLQPTVLSPSKEPQQPQRLTSAAPFQFQLQPDVHFTSPSASTPPSLAIAFKETAPRADPGMSMQWTSSSDEDTLTSTLLAKFRVRSQDWEACCSASPRATIGERWKALLGEDDAENQKIKGMRRGMGLQRRMALEDLDFNAPAQQPWSVCIGR